jgi:hypothetical protein
MANLHDVIEKKCLSRIRKIKMKSPKWLQADFQMPLTRNDDKKREDVPPAK